MEEESVMQFVNMRELSRSPSKYVTFANEQDDVIITKNGRPYAILSKIDSEELEDYILAKHFNLEKEFESAKANPETLTDLDDLIDDLSS